MNTASNRGTGRYFDGMTGVRREVAVELTDTGLRVLAPDGRLYADWPYHALQELAAPAGLLRIGRRGGGVLARLEIADPEFAAAIDMRAVGIDRTGTIQRRQRTSVIAWSVFATVSLVLVAYFGVPELASRLAPYVPPTIERKLGDAVDAQVRAMIDTGNAGAAFECGTADNEKPGRAALAKLVGRLETAAGLPIPLRVMVVRRTEPNAIALPGAQIYVFRGLIAQADSPDEVAGVLAHEIGHIAHRDGTRSILQAAGLSFLFGMVLGDFVGGGAVVLAARTALQSSYSREVEGAADIFGVDLLTKAGGNGRALGTLLTRIGGATEPGMKILLDHPETKARVAAINAAAGSRQTRPLLDAAEWAALKRICGGT